MSMSSSINCNPKLGNVDMGCIIVSSLSGKDSSSLEIFPTKYPKRFDIYGEAISKQRLMAA